MEHGVIGAFYGFKGERLGWARDASVKAAAGDQVTLTFVSGVGSTLRLRLTSGDELSGSFTAPSTSSSSCRLAPCEITFRKRE